MRIFPLLSSLAYGGLATAQFVHNHLPIGSNFPPPGENATFDYVVVGAGIGGLVTATRLAEDGRYSVAILEAGSFYQIDNSNRSVIPGYDFYSAGFLDLQGVNGLIDWRFMTTPQAGVNGLTKHYPRGKCLGGSSARNYMVYQRPTKGTMQKWADDVDDQSWTWDRVLPFYKRSTTFTPPDMSIRAVNATPMYDAGAFGDGPLQVSYSHYASPYASWVERAWDEVGDPARTNGMQSGDLLGHQYLPVSLDAATQERSSSQTYLEFALKNTQLNVYTHALVKRILFDGKKTATGVEVETGGMQYFISANKEVIVSAGAFQSPQLLMVSGIGPKHTLQKFDIPVIKDLPGVGQNMEDNPLFAINLPVDVETSMSYMTNPSKMAAALAEYNEHRSGYLTSAGADAISFQRLLDMPEFNISAKARQDLAWLPADWPDIMFWAFPVWVGPFLGSMPPDLGNYAAFIGSLTAPLSRGDVTLQSADMADPPLINPNWMTHPTDQELAVAALRRIRHFTATRAMQSIATGPEAFPGAHVTSDEDLLAVVHGQTSTFAHAAVTCKMGVPTDGMAVVDSRARVFGVRGLRVVDLSAVPFLPPGQPQASVYMLGEKIADDILHGEGAGGGSASKPSARDEL